MRLCLAAVYSPRAMSTALSCQVQACSSQTNKPTFAPRPATTLLRRGLANSWLRNRQGSRPAARPPTHYAPRIQGAPGRSLLLAAALSTSSNSRGSFRTPAATPQVADIGDMAVRDGYNAADNASYWETRPVPVISRLIRIGVEVARWRLLSSGLGASLGPKGTTGPASSPALLLDALVRLGPAFVKIGQALSSRPDVLPPEFLLELEKLQDRIPPFSNAEAAAVIEQDLGKPLATVYPRISADPVAAASLGQVYRAQLADGRDVAVKVQRPGVVQMIAMDVFILRYMAAAMRKWFKFNTDLPALVDEWATSLFKELDYNREAANATRFKKLFLSMPEVYVPEVYDEFTTTRVLTMEWVDGERLRTASSSGTAPGDVKGSPEDLQLVEIGVRCSLEQMLDQGFYHADPHPGNLLKMPDGRLAYLDFGMMGSIDAPIRQALVRATLHLVNREYEALADDMVALGFLPQGSDRSQVVPALTGVFQQALQGGVSNLSFGDLSTSLGRTMYKFKFRIPSYYTLLVRSLTVLEGIALASDRNYKVLSASYPWVARRLLTDSSPELHATLRGLLYTDQGRFQFTRLTDLLEQAAKVRALGQMRQNGSSGVAGSGSGARSGGKKGPGTSPLKLLLSTEGEFVRGILLDEVAKGIDAAWRLSFDATVEAAKRTASSPPGFPLLLPLQSSQWGLARRPLTLPLWGDMSGQSSHNLLAATSFGSLLQGVPKLAGAEDEEQIQGLSRLATALYAIASPSSSSPEVDDGGSEGQALLGMLPPLLPSTAQAQVQQAAAFFRWLATELSSLPQAERQAAMMIPLQIVDRVTSRLIARAIRTAVTPGAVLQDSE